MSRFYVIVWNLLVSTYTHVLHIYCRYIYIYIHTHTHTPNQICDAKLTGRLVSGETGKMSQRKMLHVSVLQDFGDSAALRRVSRGWGSLKCSIPATVCLVMIGTVKAGSQRQGFKVNPVGSIVTDVEFIKIIKIRSRGSSRLTSSENIQVFRLNTWHAGE